MIMPKTLKELGFKPIDNFLDPAEEVRVLKGIKKAKKMWKGIINHATQKRKKQKDR